MKRRTFLTATAAASLLPFAARAAGFVEYTPGLIQSELDAGRTVLVDYAADWCSTCARQERVITALRGGNPAYDQAMTFVRVDWDEFARHEVTTSRGVPRRSTLILLRGDQELGRIVAGTSQSQIKGLLDRAL
ncbi:thioredoxin family protein [Tateyamaria sp. ANG-S1]|uniref:thioredoxin family protein n=1 Tax=Tateyamaria sp. ANG-S1 TaxID=1577905 RepID=UPI00057F4CEE|nr:thioredoxin family protein [Tateyamaria sp. ANG-S1]KIC50043.1 thioredoxin [Tateyamaria sp. ANG-S1]